MAKVGMLYLHCAGRWRGLEGEL
jgi:hypothetical protein